MKKSVWFLSFVLALSLVVCNAHAATWYSQNFDKLTDGKMAGQDGWELIPATMAADIGSPTVQSAVVHGASGKALKVEAKQEISRNFTPVHTGTQFLIIYFRKEDKGTDNTLHVYLGKDVHEWSSGPVIRIGKDSGGDPDKVGAHDGADRKQVATFVPGKWHEIRLVVLYDKLTYSTYFDGKLVAEGLKFRNNNHNALGWLMIGFDTGVGVLGYYDDIIMGDGDGSNVTVAAVHPDDKLTTTWGSLK